MSSAAAGRVGDDGLTWSDRADDVHSHVPLAPTFVSVLFAEAIGDTRPLLDERQLLHGGGAGASCKGHHRQKKPLLFWINYRKRAPPLEEGGLL